MSAMTGACQRSGQDAAVTTMRSESAAAMTVASFAPCVLMHVGVYSCIDLR